MTAEMRAAAGLVRDSSTSVCAARRMVAVVEHTCYCVRGEKTPAECVQDSPDQFRPRPDAELSGAA